MSPDLVAAANFLAEEGGTEVLLAIEPGDGNTKGEITGKVPMSDKTVQKRLETAVDLDLLELSRGEPDDHANVKRYYLNQLGRVVLVAIVSLDLDETLQDYYDLQEQIDDDKNDLRAWLTSEEAGLIFNDPSTESEEMEEQLQQANAYPGDDLPANFDEFVSKDAPDARMEIMNQIEDELDYKSF